MALSTSSPGLANDETAIAAALERRRAASAERWDLGPEVVLVGAGDPVSIPGRDDLVYRFRAHSDYFYLTDRERAGGVLAFTSDQGWVDFVRPISTAERLWEGAPSGPIPGRPVAGLEAWLDKRAGRPVAVLGAPVPGVDGDPELADRLRRQLHQVRRPKDEVELARMRIAERATAAGFARVAGLIAPGRSERELQIELEAEFFRHGGDVLSFDTIVASGPNSAVLHFPPTGRRLAAGELVLIDAGSEYRGYASDVTRTLPVSGRLTSEQAVVYGIVRRALETTIEQCRPGVESRALHLSASAVIAEGLVDLGVLRGPVEDLVASGAVARFFPHGIGHLVGLGTRDASALPHGYAPDPSIPGLRNNLPLLTGYVTTVEPGVYFVPALLGDAEARAELGHRVDWGRVDSLLGFGGIRLEQNVLITDDGPEVLTADIPLLG
ncbi:MAG TPA: aminopeptidase P family protein [Solirubrobacteraceae bacterium]